ncbi:MAG: arylsulfatase [Planctomycetota bacterium]
MATMIINTQSRNTHPTAGMDFRMHRSPFVFSPPGFASLFTICLGLLLCQATPVTGMSAQDTATNPRPNVILILADDQGWGDLSCSGNSNLETPNIDSLASQGISLDRFYVCAVCSPTRAELLTGRYHQRMGVCSTSEGGERFDLSETTLPQLLQGAGYKTHAFGKWHSGMQYPYHPLGRGFDEYYGFASGHWGNYYSPMLEHNGRIVKGDGFLVDDLTNHALTVIDDHVAAQIDQRDPFFVYLPYNTPHAPMQVPDRWWDAAKDRDITMRHRDGKEDVDFTRAALAMVENIDWNVGRLLDRLREKDLERETIVIYLSDNGPNSKRWNGGMKGRKGSVDEGGLRSPCKIRWTGHLRPGQTVETICSGIDLLPTLCSLCDVPTKTNHPLDGRDISALLREGDTSESTDVSRLKNRTLFSVWKGKTTARTNRYRLTAGQLFDMQVDPQQRMDLSKKRPQQLAKLQNRLDAFLQQAPALPRSYQDARPMIAGHPGLEFTQLPARDATATGNIQRSNRWPNCSFYTNWKSKDDEIYWDILVPDDGEFDVTLYYTLKPGNEGTVVSLGSATPSAGPGDAANPIRVTLDRAFDPPLRGMENDRVKRPESYVKDWATAKMGTIALGVGRQRLMLRCEAMPGDHCIDFRLIMLHRRQR